MSKLSTIQNTLERKVGQRDLLLKQKEIKTTHLLKYKRERRNIERVQLILQEVAQQTQKEIRLYISNLVSLALASIYDDPYTFELKFIEKRNRTEAVPLFVRGGKKYIPGRQTGGGPLDIASFALRLSLWCLNKNIISNTIVLDEPFKFLDINAKEKAAVLLQHLSEKLNLQFIIITHDKKLTLTANKIFEIT